MTNRISMGKGPMVIADAEVVTRAYVCKRCGRVIQPNDLTDCAFVQHHTGLRVLPHVWPTESE